MNLVMKAICSVLVLLVPATALAEKSFNSGKGATWDCAQDGEVSVNTSNGTYTFKGACKEIHLNGSGLTATIESIDELSINGSRNTVTVSALAAVSVNGSDNTVTYGKGNKANPQVTNNGKNNTIKTGSAATVQATAAPAAPVAPAGVTMMDCAKQPTVSINKAKGNYKLVGTCTKVTVAGSENRMSIEAAKNLAVTGSKNELTVDKADKIAVMGSNNRVAYNTGLTAAMPKVATAGKGNTVAGSVAAQAGTTSTGTAMPATAAGAIDCGKSASHVIDGNNGTYVYTGKCDSISITGNDNKVTVESAKTISVSGNDNNLNATAVDAVSLSGNDNIVSWKKGVSAAKAKVANSGNDNKISQAK
jgi:hypothetical protein